MALSWRLSNTLDGAFCVKPLNEAIHRFWPPVFIGATICRLGGAPTRFLDQGKVRQISGAFPCPLHRLRVPRCPAFGRLFEPIITGEPVMIRMAKTSGGSFAPIAPSGSNVAPKQQTVPAQQRCCGGSVIRADRTTRHGPFARSR